MASSDLNTDNPPYCPRSGLRVKLCIAGRRETSNEETPGAAGMQWARRDGGRISPGSPSQGAESHGRLHARVQTLTQIKPAQLGQQPENERPFGHFDCWPTPGVCLSAQTSFLILLVMLTGRDPCVFISLFSVSKPSLSSNPEWPP